MLNSDLEPVLIFSLSIQICYLGYTHCLDPFKDILKRFLNALYGNNSH